MTGPNLARFPRSSWAPPGVFACREQTRGWRHIEQGSTSLPYALPIYLKRNHR